jgi:ribonuclease HII
MDLYRYDEALRNEGFVTLAGIDEAGRGPIAGPVVAAAVILPENLRIEGLRDSKKVPEKERASLFREILPLALHIGVGVVDNGEIDRLNILRATKLAMLRAVEDLAVLPDLLVIDAVALPSLSVKQISLIRAESISASVAAASIVAKYVRDAIMRRFHEIYPEYNFKKHKGYCTREHLEMVRKFGPCDIHRKTFDKVLSLELPFEPYRRHGP